MTTPAPRAVLTLAATLAVALVAVGCDDGRQESAPARPFEATFVPESLLDLRVAREDLGAVLSSVPDTYLAEVDLHSIRDGEQLVATLQVGRFRHDVDPADETFRQALLAQTGSSAPRLVYLDASPVWMTTGGGGPMAVWFEDDLLFVLGIRPEFNRPRSLIRAALDLETA